MELTEALRRRRMVRSYLPRPVHGEALDRVLRAACSGPSAGFSQGLDLVVLQGPDQTSRLWDASLPPERRPAFPWPALVDAPVVVVVLARPASYTERYSEPDKASTGLGASETAWPVPYWYVDCGVALGLMLLAAVDEGLGAAFFGLFGNEGRVLRALGVPGGHRAVGAMTLGYPAEADRPSSSARRPRRPPEEIIHRGRW